MTTYNHLNEYYKSIFKERTLKIPVDGYFTCPNRDGKCGTGGCIFCDERGSGKVRTNVSIKEQVLKHLNSYRGQRANKFIVYFQNYTNTYDTIENLKSKYDEALMVSDKIVGLSIATRPDCINSAIASLLAEYKAKHYVQVELGFQTSNNETGMLINRCYDTETFINAVKLLNEYGIDIVVHIMVGLPKETRDDISNTISLINSLKIQGIKIHSTYVVEGTKLNEMYKQGLYEPISLDEYIDSVVYILTHVNKNIIVHRISGDAPKDILVAPEWNLHKKLVLNGVENLMKEKGLYQGMFN